MADENLKLPPLVDEKVIDTCLELLAAGRPLSEIMVEAKRRSTVSLEHPPFEAPEADQAISAKKPSTQPLTDTGECTKETTRPLTDRSFSLAQCAGGYSSYRISGESDAGALDDRAAFRGNKRNRINAYHPLADRKHRNRTDGE